MKRYSTKMSRNRGKALGRLSNSLNAALFLRVQLSPPSRFEGFKVILGQLHGQRGISRPAPAIALNAADRSLIG
jgi:hypothetical protein